MELNELERCLHISPNFFQVSPNLTNKKRHKVDCLSLSHESNLHKPQALSGPGKESGGSSLSLPPSREGLNCDSLLHRCSSGASELSLSMFRPNASDSSLAGVHVYEQNFYFETVFFFFLPQVLDQQCRLPANSGLAKTASAGLRCKPEPMRCTREKVGFGIRRSWVEFR